MVLPVHASHVAVMVQLLLVVVPRVVYAVKVGELSLVVVAPQVIFHILLIAVLLALLKQFVALVIILLHLRVEEYAIKDVPILVYF